MLRKRFERLTEPPPRERRFGPPKKKSRRWALTNSRNAKLLQGHKLRCSAQTRPGWRIETSLRRASVPAARGGGGCRRSRGAPPTVARVRGWARTVSVAAAARFVRESEAGREGIICRSQTSHTPPHTLRTSLASRPIRRPVSGNQSAGKPVINGSAFEGRPREPICRGRGAGVGTRAPVSYTHLTLPTKA